MKTLAEIDSLATAFHANFGIDIKGAPQGSEAWYQSKLGVISASNAAKAIAKRDTETRATYMANLVAQVGTGLIEEINGKALEWGKQHEAAARSCYAFSRDVDIVELPFVFKDENFRVGCSPDGFVQRDGVIIRPVEIKCPYDSTNYVKFLTDDKIKPEYLTQYNFQMWALGAGEMDFVQYDPRMHVKPQHVVTVERNDALILKFEEMIPQFIEDMDAMLDRAGLKFGDQWRRLAKAAQVSA